MSSRFTPRRVAAIAFVAALAGPSLAGAQTFDFETLNTGLVPGATLVQSSMGVTATFTATGLQVRDIAGFGFPGGARRVLSSADDGSVITMTLDQAVTGITFRNWISGVYTPEADFITVRVFDASNTQIGTLTSGAEFVSLDADGIVRVEWDDDQGTGYVLDDITLRGANQNVVPEPGTYALMATGLAGLGVLRRRRRA